jgi:hypothetical protein
MERREHQLDEKGFNMRSFRYRKLRALLAATLGVCALGAGRAGAQDEQQPTGGFDLSKEADKRMYQRYAERADIKVDQVDPIFKAERVSHVANGVALRNRTRGFIQSRGVPLKSQVVRSFLLWNLSDSEKTGADGMPVLFDGNLVIGRKTADNTDPCWGRAGNHSYIADVTDYTDQTGGPNQDYEVTLAFSADTSTSGQDPWTSFDGSKTLLEGASLVVIFRNENTEGPLYLFAPPGDNMFLSSASYSLPSPGLGRGLFTMIGGDGQRGSSHSNFASNELTFFDGVQIAGPPVAASDWDGSDGLTLPQLWDTHTHEVQIANASSQIDYQQNVDCLVAVGFVLDQE